VGVLILVEVLCDNLVCAQLKVAQWSDKSVTAAAVFNTISKTLFETLPYPTYQNDDIDLKTNLVFEHFKNQYAGGGMGVYGGY
jgi:type I restriction enzyme R subunit